MDTLLLISSILLWMVVLFNLLISFRLIQIVAPGVWAENSPRLKNGDRAPDFKITKMEGEEVALSVFKDRPALFVFISLSCSACLKEVPKIQTFSPSISQSGVQLCVICDGDQNKARAFTQEFGILTPVFCAPRDNSIWKQYKVSGTPYFCLIDAQSRVQDAGIVDSNFEVISRMVRINALS